MSTCNLLFNKKNSSFDIIDLNGAKYLNYSPDNGVNIEQPLLSE